MQAKVAALREYAARVKSATLRALMRHITVTRHDATMIVVTSCLMLTLRAFICRRDAEPPFDAAIIFIYIMPCRYAHAKDGALRYDAALLILRCR